MLITVITSSFDLCTSKAKTISCSNCKKKYCYRADKKLPNLAWFPTCSWEALNRTGGNRCQSLTLTADSLLLTFLDFDGCLVQRRPILSGAQVWRPSFQNREHKLVSHASFNPNERKSCNCFTNWSIWGNYFEELVRILTPIVLSSNRMLQI